jgi:PEP-CTERM motif
LTPTRTIVSDGVVFFAHAGEFGPNLYDLVPDPPALDNYMLDASIGPLFAFGLLNQWTASPLIDTTRGILIFDDTNGQDSPGSFQAILVPEPQPLALLAAGALALGWSRRKRTRVTTPSATRALALVRRLLSVR